MALLDTNLSGVAVIDQPGGVNATAANFIDPYDYAMIYQPELIPQLHMANGLGKITGFMRLTGTDGSYAADQVQHAEEFRLHNILKDVAVVGTTFTSPTAHNLRPGDVIKVSDGLTIERQATVESITTTLQFEASNDAGGAFGFGGNVDVIADFSNSWEKETENFTTPRRWSPEIYKNYSQIIKEVYRIPGSDMLQDMWVQTNDGPRWFNHELMRTSALFDNKIELTNIFFERKAAGNARGMKGVVSQVEERGNLVNEYITTIDELSGISKRAKQQGTCREFTVWSDHQQMANFRVMMAGVNAGYVNGAHYGAFSNSKDMALKLDFSSVLVDGVTFHFTPWALLEDPTLMGNEKFGATGIGALIVPSGGTYAQENGNTVSKPYLSILYRQDGNYSRRKEIKLFGPKGTAQSLDAQTTEMLTECTNQLVGANNFFVVRRGVFYS